MTLLYLITAVFSLHEGECIGRCDNPQPLAIFRGTSPNEVMMKEMTSDLQKLLESNMYSDLTSITGKRVECLNGFAGEYPCNNVDLLSFVPHSETQGRGAQGNDIWGWEDPLTGKEYAIVCQTAGTSFFDISDPLHPIFKGRLPTKTSSSTWRDAKVYNNHAYIVSEANQHGVQVFDLTLLRAPGTAQIFKESGYYKDTGRCHNIAINEETAMAYCVGSRNVCNAGLYMLDISEPKVPKYAGCYGGDGYFHDTQCVIYRGPDVKYQGKEICFGYNEDTVTIVDVTNRAKPVLISRTGYKSYSYTHQGWLLENQAFLMFDDELDEKKGTNVNKGKTTTYILNVTSLEYPVLASTHVSPVTAIDHNLYIRDGKAYMANYGSGLRIVDINAIEKGITKEIGFFDVHPEDNDVSFSGSWSVYPYFKSGVVIVNSIERGLFVLQPRI